MKTKAVLTEQDVAQLLEAAKELAHQRQWAVSICVVDDGGHPLGLLRLDTPRRYRPTLPRKKPAPPPWVDATARSSRT